MSVQENAALPMNLPMKGEPRMHRACSSFLALMLLVAGPLAMAQTDSGGDARFGRGQKLYDRYCARCHGKEADGEGRMVKRLYRKKGTQLPSNFTLSVYADRPAAYLRKIIVEGGENNDMSKYMPPFGQELSPRDVDDLIYLIKLVPEKYARSSNQ